MVRKELWASATFYGSPAETDTTERPDSKVEVISGMDTHLDVHVGVTVDHLLGREAWAS
jgi:hypothetical protein